MSTLVQDYTSKIDNVSFKYFVEDGVLSYKFDGTDWQDFTTADRRAYSPEEYAEFVSLLKEDHVSQ